MQKLLFLKITTVFLFAAHANDANATLMQKIATFCPSGTATLQNCWCSTMPHQCDEPRPLRDTKQNITKKFTKALVTWIGIIHHKPLCT